jgi:hypothetical protein
VNRKTLGKYRRESTRERRADAKAHGRCLICFEARAHPDHPSMCRDCREKKNAARRVTK